MGIPIECFDDSSIFVCPACFDVPIDPVVIVPCGHILCRSCLNSDRCFCRQFVKSFKPLSGKCREQYDSLIVRCLRCLRTLSPRKYLQHRCSKRSLYLQSSASPINVRNGDGFTQLHLAAREGKTQEVLRLLNGGADPSIKTTHGGASAVHMALYRGHSQTVMAILSFVKEGLLEGVYNSYYVDYEVRLKSFENPYFPDRIRDWIPDLAAAGCYHEPLFVDGCDMLLSAVRCFHCGGLFVDDGKDKNNDICKVHLANNPECNFIQTIRK